MFLSLVAGLVYCVSGLGRHVVTGGWVQYVEFTFAVPVLAVFALEDSVLTALRLAPWVAAENITTVIARIALLPVLFVTAMGAVWSTVLPMLVAAVIVNSLLFGRALPAHGSVPGTLPRRRRLLSFVAAEYAGNICAIASVQVMPLIVVWRLGPAAAAYLTLPWLIASGITLVLWNVSASFVVEAAGSHGHPGTLLRRSLLLWSGIVAAAMIVCVAGARPLMELVGAQYVARRRAAAAADRAERSVHRRGGHLRDAGLARPAGLAAGRLPGLRRDPAARVGPGAAAAAGADRRRLGLPGHPGGLGGGGDAVHRAAHSTSRVREGMK